MAERHTTWRQWVGGLLVAVLLAAVTMLGASMAEAVGWTLLIMVFLGTAAWCVLELFWWWARRRDAAPVAPSAVNAMARDEMGAIAQAGGAPERDVSVLSALHYIAFGDWTVRRWLTESHPAGDAERLGEADDAFRQAAADGLLPVWGRPRGTSIYEPIPADYWRACGVEWLAVLSGDEGRIITEVREPGYRSLVPPYDAPMTGREAVERVWPGSG